MNKMCLKCGKSFQGAGDICQSCIEKANAPQNFSSSNFVIYKNNNGLFKKYFSFSNRVNRFQFFVRTLLIILLNINMLIFDYYITTKNLNIGLSVEKIEQIILAIFILSLISFITLIIRRLHDSESSCWWLLGGWIFPPLVIIILYKLLFSSGTDGENEYGTQP